MIIFFDQIAARLRTGIVKWIQYLRIDLFFIGKKQPRDFPGLIMGIFLI